MKDRIIFDASTARRIDENGYLHVTGNRLTKAVVNPYYGHEIPGWEEAGLDPQTLYYGLRAPEELQKAVSTFAGLPLQMEHHPDSAHTPQTAHRVGAIGTDAAWVAPYLVASLCVWDATAIEAIESGRMKELSCAYRYVPDFTPGTYEGQPYDFVMRDIRGNHVALVEEGRVGPDVVVADSRIPKTPRTKTDRTSAQNGRSDRSDRSDPLGHPGHPGRSGRSATADPSEVFATSGTGQPTRARGTADVCQTSPEADGLTDSTGSENGFAALCGLIHALSAVLTPEVVARFSDLTACLTPRTPQDDADGSDRSGRSGHPGVSGTSCAAGLSGVHGASGTHDVSGVSGVSDRSDGSATSDPLDPSDGSGASGASGASGFSDGGGCATALGVGGLDQAMADCGLDTADPAICRAFAEGAAWWERRSAAGRDGRERRARGCGMDAAAVRQDAVRQTRRQLQALLRAARKVRPLCGDVDPLAFDSAQAIYRHALESQGRDASRYRPDAWEGIVEVMLEHFQTDSRTPSVVQASSMLAHLDHLIC